MATKEQGSRPSAGEVSKGVSTTSILRSRLWSKLTDQGSVKALACHPTLPIAVSGGDDGCVRVWGSEGGAMPLSSYDCGGGIGAIAAKDGVVAVAMGTALMARPVTSPTAMTIPDCRCLPPMTAPAAGAPAW